ncbi:RNA polymerase sigma factor [Nocardia salmonicida]|uniref:RNA polymerase sigma factor n=1 Tax=Nocardia salmonicida TaxID=53431 RepID=UPI0007A49249|nr:sigma-70 family RNA polymerase sigma factor [Nocardia salmonicida]
MNPDDFAQWLGRPLDDVPPEQREAVFVYVLGASVVEVATYAAGEAAFLLSRHDPDMRDAYPDIAHDVLEKFFEKLPAERVEFWKAYTRTRVLWQIHQQRRERLAAKRHPGRRVEFDDAVTGHPDSGSVDDFDWIYVKDLLATAIAAIPDAEVRTVLEVSYVWPTEHSDFHALTAEQVAELLGLSTSKVKKLWSKGKKIIRHLLCPETRDVTEVWEATS